MPGAGRRPHNFDSGEPCVPPASAVRADTFGPEAQQGAVETGLEKVLTHLTEDHTEPLDISRAQQIEHALAALRLTLRRACRRQFVGTQVRHHSIGELTHAQLPPGRFGRERTSSSKSVKEKCRSLAPTADRELRWSSRVESSQLPVRREGSNREAGAMSDNNVVQVRQRSAVRGTPGRDQDRHLLPADKRPASTARGLHHTALISSDVRTNREVLPGSPQIPTHRVDSRTVTIPGRRTSSSTSAIGNLLAFFDFPELDVGPYQEVLGGLHHIAISVETCQVGEAGAPQLTVEAGVRTDRALASNHYDPKNTHHGLLLVNNDDIVTPGMGFDTHPHQDMERSIRWGIRASSAPVLAQRMSAGTGILHSEKNDSWRLGDVAGDAFRRDSTATRFHFIQMWVVPDEAGITPGYEQLEIDAELLAGGLVPVASGMNAYADHYRQSGSRTSTPRCTLRVCNPDNL
ncbi:unnamed protein product, partial [Mesorhabditis spiculigera]